MKRRTYSICKWVVLAGSLGIHTMLLLVTIPTAVQTVPQKQDTVRIRLVKTPRKIEQPMVSLPVAPKKKTKPVKPSKPAPLSPPQPPPDPDTMIAAATPTPESTAVILDPDTTPVASTPVLSQGEIDSIRNEWYASISAAVERLKKYPKQALLAEIEGTVTISMTIERSGTVRSCAIASGKNGVLERGTLATLAVLKSVPPIPPECREPIVTIALPLVYKLK